MNCKICGAKNIQMSMGGPDICGRCDCGLKPNGERLDYTETMKIAQNYQQNNIPYCQGVFEPQSN